jgi:hypothetical protein
VRPRAHFAGLDAFGRRLAAIATATAAPAAAAAADALHHELERVRERDGLPPLARDGAARRRRIVAADPASVARELGTFDQAPAPWLAPVLPGARRPMRAAAAARVRDVVAVHAGKRNNAAVRAISRLRRR